MFFLFACEDGPTLPGEAPGAQKTVTALEQKYILMDTPSDKIAVAVPTFGGAYVSNGTLMVYLSAAGIGNQQIESAARAAISGVLASIGRTELAVKFIPGQHTFLDLRSYETTLRNSYSRLGVRSAGIDEKNNRIAIAIAPGYAIQSVGEQVASANIPASAVQAELASDGGPLTLLTDKVRPTKGGLSMEATWNSGGILVTSFCTYGFNAQIQGSTTRYMITNAHCVQPLNTLGNMVGASIFQNVSGFFNTVGTVTSNPPTFTGLGCAAGDQCRNSDAALTTVSLGASDWDLGGIARTTTRGTGPGSSGSLTINASSPRIALAGASSFFQGDSLEKIGQTTGWTAGVVTATCAYHVDSFHHGRVCDGVVAAGANSGDSGSPVFWKSASGAYYLMGILWGGANGQPGGPNTTEFWFSRFTSVKSDLSPTANLLVN